VGPFHISIPSDPTAMRRVQDDIEQLLGDWPGSAHDLFGIKLALEEALVNALKHGNQMDRSRQVHISYCLLPDRFEVSILDEGSGFDPDEVPDPTAAENLERPSGRGLILMRHYMSEVAFLGPGNCVRMSKLFRGNGRK